MLQYLTLKVIQSFIRFDSCIEKPVFGEIGVIKKVPAQFVLQILEFYGIKSKSTNLLRQRTKKCFNQTADEIISGIIE